MEKNITDILKSFMTEMNQWENDANHYIDEGHDLPNDDLKEKLSIIYSKYVTTKERKMGRLNNPFVLFPPEYDPKLETPVEIKINGKQATVTTDRTYAKINKQRIYKLKYIDNTWKIDSIKEVDTYNGKLQTVYL